MTRDTGPLPAKLYKTWTIWPPKAATQLWTAFKDGMIRTAWTEDEVKEQVDAYQDGTET